MRIVNIVGEDVGMILELDASNMMSDLESTSSIAPHERRTLTTRTRRATRRDLGLY